MHGHAAHTPIWLILLFAAGSGWTLREMARGLVRERRGVRRTPLFAALWLGCAAVLVVLAGVHGHGLESELVVVAAALGAGFGLAAGLTDAGEASYALLRGSPYALALWLRATSHQHQLGRASRPVSASPLGTWSSRGPPRRAHA